MTISVRLCKVIFIQRFLLLGSMGLQRTHITHRQFPGEPDDLQPFQFSEIYAKKQMQICNILIMQGRIKTQDNYYAVQYFCSMLQKQNLKPLIKEVTVTYLKVKTVSSYQQI